jgi:hypothetical protein
MRKIRGQQVVSTSVDGLCCIVQYKSATLPSLELLLLLLPFQTKKNFLFSRHDDENRFSTVKIASVPLSSPSVVSLSLPIYYNKAGSSSIT